MSEKTIQDKLYSYFIKDPSTRYMTENSHIFMWECDFFVLQRNGYAVEFEIKCTKADFKADFKKVDKHQILQDNNTGLSNVSKWKPNKFYYVAPHGILKLEDIPDYAGFIEIDKWNSLNIKRKAPFIHKEKLDLVPKLCDKFYYKWLKLRK